MGTEVRCGSVSYATPQGVSHLMKWFYDHGVITDVLLVKHPRHPYQADWYPPDTPVVNPKNIAGPEVDAFLSRIQVMLIWETPFDWRLIDRCRARGIRVVFCPMSEWFPCEPSAMPDKFICPSVWDVDMLKHFGKPCVFLPIPVDASRWKLRTKALRYLSNAGHVGHREHKGTRQLLEALKYVKSPLTLTVRCQYEGMIEQMAASSIGPEFHLAPSPAPGVTTYIRESGLILHLESGYLPYDTLWDGYDVYVAPEKLNGISLPLQEAYSAGLLVITTNRFPMNTWLPNPPMIPVSGYHTVKIAGPYLPIEEAIVDPHQVAETMDAWFNANITEYSESGRQWGLDNSWEALVPAWKSALEE